MNKRRQGALSTFMGLVLAVGLSPAAYANPSAQSTDTSKEGKAQEAAGGAEVTAVPESGGANGSSAGSDEHADPNENVTVIVELESGQMHGGFFGLFGESGADHNYYKDRIAELLDAEKKKSDSGESALSPQSYIDDSSSRDFNSVIDGFTIQVPRGIVDDIRNLDGVAAVFENETHAVPGDLGVQENAPKNTDSLSMTGANEVSYTGKGQVIAIVDTGLKTDHEGFSGDLDDSSLVLTEEKINQIKGTLSYGSGGKYISEKIPFAYDYAMGDDNVADGSGHGTHVAGIAGANAGDVRGAAPDAQLLIMKVATDQGTIMDDALLAALDDCAKFGVDAVNISIGADGGFSGDAQDTFANAVDMLEKTGVVVNVAAGNSYSSAQGNLSGKNLPYATDPDSGTISSPASADVSTAVASANNVLPNPYFTLADGTKVEWQSAKLLSDGSAWPTLDSIADGDYEMVDLGAVAGWVYEEGTYTNAKYPGKIILVERGGTTARGTAASWGDKIRYTEPTDAAAIIFYDNEDADTPVKCALDEWATYVSKRIPAVSITKADAQKLKAAIAQGEKISIKAGQVTSAEGDPSINDFSSWGATPDLSLKPDITAPGGNIYSTTNDGSYAYMSGTSMATPQMTGVSAQIAQYVESDAKFASMNDTQKKDVVTQLLMNTAKPLSDSATSGAYFSPRQQGAGIANVPAAIATNVYATVDGAKSAAHPKAELGASAAGRWTFAVTLHNLGNEEAQYNLNTLALSDQIANGLFQQHSIDYAGNGISISYGGQGASGSVSVPAGGTASYTVTIACEESFKQAVAEASNGTFVDGFVMLKGVNGATDLSIPFMGFYGDWGKASVFDGKLATSDAHLWGNYLKTDNIGIYGGPLGFNPLDTESIYDYNNKSSMSSRGDWRKYYYPERLVVSNSSDQYAPHTVSTQSFLLRGASDFMWGFSKKDAEAGIQAYYAPFVKKSRQNTSASGDPVLTAEAIRNGYAGFSFSGQDEGWYEIEEYAKVAGSGSEQKLNYDIYYDKTAPAVSNVSNTEGPDATLSFTVTDASWLAGVTVQTNPVYQVSTSESIKKFLADDLNLVESVDASGNRVYDVSIPIAKLKEAWNAGNGQDESNMPNTLALVAWDWGMNPSEPITAVLNPEPATGITIAPSSLNLAPGQYGTLEATLSPADTTDVLVDWESADENVATVDSTGKVTGKAPGKTSIKATVHGREVSSSIEVSVSPISDRTGVVLSDDVVRVHNNGGEGQVDAMLASSLDSKTVNWSVSDESIFTVESKGNTVKLTGGYQVGTATLYATVVDGDGFIHTAEAQVHNWPDDYEDFAIDDEGKLTGYTGVKLNVEIPNNVKVIGESAFEEKRATEYRIPASVERIEKNAFLNTPAQQVVFEDTSEHPSHLVEVGERAFANTSSGQFSWTSFRLPESVTTLGTGVMEGKSCERIYIPKSVTVIPDNAFTGTHDEVYIGDDVTFIGDNAFSAGNAQAMMFSTLYIIGREREQTVTEMINGQSYTYAKDSLLPSKLEHIGSGAFKGTSAFTSINMPSSLRHIGDEAFLTASQSIHNNGGPALSLTLNEGLEEIGKNAFSGTRIEEVTIPNSVSKLGDGAFSSIGILKKVTIGNQVEAKALGKVFSYSDSITEFVVGSDCANYVVDKQGIVYSKDMTSLVAFPMGKENPDYLIPEGVRIIDECAFDAYDGEFLDFCDNYPHSIVFPSTLETIKAHALNTHLELVDLGSNVKSIDNEAFGDINGHENLNPASPTHLVVRGGSDYTVGHSNNVGYYQTSYFGPGVKSIDFSGDGFRTSDVMVVNSDTLDEFKFTTNAWPDWYADPIKIYAKKGSQAYSTIKQGIIEKNIDFGYYYDGWCVDEEENATQYGGARKPILNYYEELTASLDSDKNIVPGKNVTLTAMIEGGIGSAEVRWFKVPARNAGLSAQSTSDWLEGKELVKDWSSDLSYEWTVSNDGSTIIAEVRDASYYTTQANLAEKPAFVMQPSSMQVVQGACAKLTAQVSVGDSGKLSYQWYKGSNADLTDATPVVGATGTELSVPTDSLGASYYALVVRNTLENGLYSEARSDVAAVTVVLADKSGLNASIDQAKAVEKGKKTDKAYQALQSAIDDALIVSTDAQATQGEVTSALEALKAAVKAFNESADEVSNVPTEVKPSNPSNSNPSPAPAGTKYMHRLYNPNSGEHFYTSENVERDNLVAAGWRSEGEGWLAPEKSNTPVYRLYNPNAGEHHYTTDVAERDALVAAGWRDEGIGWYSDDNQAVPLYRDYNPNAFSNNHNYTTDKAEHEGLVALGWRSEGYAWYGSK